MLAFIFALDHQRRKHPEYAYRDVHVEYRRANQVYDDVTGNVVDLGGRLSNLRPEVRRSPQVSPRLRCRVGQQRPHFSLQ